MHAALSINRRQALIAKISPLSLEINGNIYHTNFLLFSLKQDALKLFFRLNRTKGKPTCMARFETMRAQTAAAGTSQQYKITLLPVLE